MTPPVALEPGAAGAPDADALLVRELGVRQLAAIIFNYVVGAGIFVLPALAAERLGPAAVLAYLVCVVLVGLMVLCFAEAGSRVAASGGPYAYVEAAMGPLAGFLAGVLNLLSAVAACGAVAQLFASSLAALLGSTAPWVRVVIMGVATAAAAVINIRGVRGGARLVEVSALVKMVPLVGFVVLGAFAVRSENLVWIDTPPLSSVLGTAGVIILAFMGIEGALQPSGEVRNPERTVPRAALLAMSAVVTLYVAIQLVAQGLLDGRLAGDHVAPLAAAAGSAFGPAGRLIMLAGATASMFGFLCGSILTGPRSLFAMGRDGFGPRILAAVHPAHRTPSVAIVVYAVVSLTLGMSGTFERLAILTNLAGLLVYLGVAVSAWMLRRKGVRLAGEPFRTPGGPLVPVFACLAILAVIVATVSSVEVGAVAAVSLVATGAYGLRQYRLARAR